jgi:hypothetical protein
METYCGLEIVELPNTNNIKILSCHENNNAFVCIAELYTTVNVQLLTVGMEIKNEFHLCCFRSTKYVALLSTV